MKRLDQMQLLKGELEHISLTDFRKRPGEVFQQVSMGKVFVVSKSGNEIAVLSKTPGVQLAIDVSRTGKIKYSL